LPMTAPSPPPAAAIRNFRPSFSMVEFIGINLGFVPLASVLSVCIRDGGDTGT
jgi:hypothetical protein